MAGPVRVVEQSQPGNRTDPLVWAAHRLKEMIVGGLATEADAELLVAAAVKAGIEGGERYACKQTMSVLRWNS
jgi:hypothetical protein